MQTVGIEGRRVETIDGSTARRPPDSRTAFPLNLVSREDGGEPPNHHRIEGRTATVRPKRRGACSNQHTR